MRLNRAIALCALLSTAGCSSLPVSLSGRPCDDADACLEGYACDPVTNLCVAEGDPCEGAYRELPCDDGGVHGCDQGVWTACGQSAFGDECVPSSNSCGAGGELITCDAFGNIAGSEPCGTYGCNEYGEGARCNECNPGEFQCVGNQHVVCGADGTVLSSEDCGATIGCTNIGSCDPFVGCSLLVVAPDGTPCDEGEGDDGNLCNSSCQGGVCTAGSNPICSDGRDCTRATCEPDRGCVFPYAEAGTPCAGDDSNLCNSTCDDQGNCDEQTPVACADDNPCTANSCSEGECFYPPGNSGFICREPAHPCDAPESCDGLSSTCPADLNQPAGTLCGDLTDTECDGRDVCDDEGSCLEMIAAAGTSCGRPAGECAVGDSCDGEGSCRDLGVFTPGTACGDDSDTECTDPDSCDADGVCLTNHIPVGFLCGDRNTTECSAADTCDGEGTCQLNHADPGTACGDPSTTDCTAPDTCDGAGVCSTHHVSNNTICDDLDACNIGELCQSGLCTGGAAPTCPSGGQCREDNFCNSGGDDGNCEFLGAPAHDDESCDDCPAGTCTNCAYGLCQTSECDGTASAEVCGSEDCAGRAACQDLAGDCRTVACAGLEVYPLEHQACSDAADSTYFGANKPCRSVNCSSEGNEDNDAAIGSDCYGKKVFSVGTAHGIIAYTFATSSPSGTPFNVWMRNYRHTELDSDERYACSLTGVAGGTRSWIFDETETGNGRFGSPCTTVTNGWCWMAADGNDDVASPDPVILDTGEHTLSCDITINQSVGETDEHFGYDGMLFTNDLSFVPDPKPNGTPCHDHDWELTAGVCVGVNWGPNAQPYVVEGNCSAQLPVANGTPCWQNGGEVCCDGVCIAGTCG